MLEILPGFSDNIIAVSATGRVTRQDYDSVLIPQVEATAKRHTKLRFYYETGADFTGFEPAAVWEDFKVGVEHWTRWERVAVVTGVAWIGFMANAFGFLLPAQVRVFPPGGRQEASAWIEAA
jgi:hypothetical protein